MNVTLRLQVSPKAPCLFMKTKGSTFTITTNKSRKKYENIEMLVS